MSREKRLQRARESRERCSCWWWLEKEKSVKSETCSSFHKERETERGGKGIVGN